MLQASLDINGLIFYLSYVLSEEIFFKNIRSIKSALDLSAEDFISQLGMTSQEAQKHLLNPKDFPLRFAMNFCEHYRLDLKTMFTEDFDLRAFTVNHFRGEPALPAHYQQEKNSRCITLINIVKGLEASGLGWINELLFRRLQIPKTILLFPELEIPVKLIVDYLEQVEIFQKNLEFMKDIGEEGISNLNSCFHLVSGSAVFTSEFYESFFLEKITQFDKTYDYRIVKFEHDQLVVECQLKDEFKEIYQTKNLSNHAFLNYKAGIGRGLSSLFGMESSRSSILSSDPESGSDKISILLPKRPLSSRGYLH